MLQKSSPPKKPMNLSHLTISTNEKISLLSNLSTMLSAGISLFESVNALLEDSKGHQKRLLESVRDDLSQGKQLHVAFSKFSGVFDSVTVNIIKASEQAGTLDVALKDLRDYIRKEIEFSDKVKSALIYPVLIFLVFLSVLLMILTFVIPKIATVFTRMKAELPLPTRILIAASDFLIHHTFEITAVVVGAIFLHLFFIRTQKKKILNILFSLPLLSGLAREIDLARFSRSLYLLLDAGLPIIYALDLTQDIVLKENVAKAIATTKEMVLSGKKLSDGFKKHRNIFPSIMIKITEAGEKSGSLEQSLLDASVYIDYQVSQTLNTLTTLLEPLMLIFIGVFVGGMMLSIIAPIYGLIGQVTSR